MKWCGWQVLGSSDREQALHHNREIKRAGAFLRRRPVPYYNKEQTPLGDLFDPNPRFHGGCFGV
jgi:hypothetical protein